jgi:hypothetical protein
MWLFIVDGLWLGFWHSRTGVNVARCGSILNSLVESLLWNPTHPFTSLHYISDYIVLLNR